MVRYRVAPHDGPRASDVGALAWLSILHMHKEHELPVPPVMDSEGFTLLWANGSLSIAVAEDEDEIIGVRVIGLFSHILSSKGVVARGITLFVPPGRRNGVGVKLGRFHNDYLEKNHDIWMWEEYLFDPRADAFAARQGYRPVATMFVKG